MPLILMLILGPSLKFKTKLIRTSPDSYGLEMVIENVDPIPRLDVTLITIP